jgi:radical SAM superfamily enzyme YgiQ (UPF0313 family)
MSLAILAALTPSNIEIKITDELVEDIDFDYPADLIGLSVMTTNAPRSYEVAEKFRQKGAKVIIGGIHPSVLPEEALDYADSILSGESEGLWKGIIEDFLRGELKRHYICKEYPDPCSIPSPRWELLGEERYFVPRTFQVSRGCPYGCSFCSSTSFFGMRYRFRPVSSIIDELRNYKKRLAVFVDDNIVGNPDYSRELFSAIKKLNKRWVAQSSIDIAKDEVLLSLASESGCAGLLIGFESIRFDNKSDVKKLKKANDYEEAIKKIKAFGIGVHGSFLFGLDGDTEDIFESTIDFVLMNRLEVANYCKITPFPGTRLYEKMLDEGRLIHRDWAKYDRYHVVFRPKHFSIEMLYKKTDWAYRKTYSPLSIWKRRPSNLKNLPYHLAINIDYWLGRRLRQKTPPYSSPY